MKQFFKDTLALVTGGAIFASGLCVFAAPNRIATGGASGLAIVLSDLLSLPLGVCIALINVPLLIASFCVCGARRTVKTLYALLMFTAVIDLFDFFVTAEYRGEALVCAVYGGLLTGMGMYVLLSRSIVTGGSDLLAYLIQRVRPGYSMSLLLLLIDGAVVAICSLYFRSLDTALYSIGLILILTLTLNTLLRGRKHSALHFILTDKPDEVRAYIDKTLGRGCTVLHAAGGYKNEPRQVILCAVNLRQSVLLRKRIFELDERAFMIVTNAERVCGNGFYVPRAEDID